MNSLSVGEVGASGVFVPQYIPKRDVALNTFKNIYNIHVFILANIACMSM